MFRVRGRGGLHGGHASAPKRISEFNLEGVVSYEYMTGGPAFLEVWVGGWEDDSFAADFRWSCANGVAKIGDSQDEFEERAGDMKAISVEVNDNSPCPVGIRKA